jgi:DNA-binding transcriptional LysR family regulator
MLDVRRLRVLREVAQLGSFSAAAESLAFTQPAVSRQIATLEAEAGTRLVERSARGVRLTQAGELLVGHADAILDRLTAAENQLEALNSLAGGRLHIGATATANSTLIPLAIRAFDAEYPEVHLRLDEALTSELIDRVAAGELDLAIVANPERYELPGEIVIDHLMDDPQHLALSRDHPLADAPEIRMEDLADEVWIEGRDSACAEPLRLAAAAAGFEPKICFESAQWLGKQGLVAAGVGITLIPTLALATVREDIVLRSLGADAPTRTISIATLGCGYEAPAVEPMRAVLRRVAEEHCFSCDACVS